MLRPRQVFLEAILLALGETLPQAVFFGASAGSGLPSSLPVMPAEGVCGCRRWPVNFALMTPEMLLPATAAERAARIRCVIEQP